MARPATLCNTFDGEKERWLELLYIYIWIFPWLSTALVLHVLLETHLHTDLLGEHTYKAIYIHMCVCVSFSFLHM